MFAEFRSNSMMMRNAVAGLSATAVDSFTNLIFVLPRFATVCVMPLLGKNANIGQSGAQGTSNSNALRYLLLGTWRRHPSLELTGLTTKSIPMRVIYVGLGSLYLLACWDMLRNNREEFDDEGLWPLCHIAHTRPLFRAADWDHYRTVNQKFAEALLEEMEGEHKPVVLVQDYHFALLQPMIKARRRAARVTIRLHIHWPTPKA